MGIGTTLSAPGAPVSAEAPMATNSFIRAADQVRQPFSDEARAIQASAQQVGPIDVSAMGYMRAIVLHVATDGTGAGGGADGHEDAPFNVLQNVSLQDTNGTSVISSIDGHTLYLINKWGGYSGSEYDPAELPTFNDVDADGEFSFKLRLPVEICERDGLGALPNLNAASTYKLNYTIASASQVYTAEPATTTPGVRVKATLEAWSQPRPSDLFGAPNETGPPRQGTTSYWTTSTVNVSPGDQRIALKRMGNLVRNWFFIFRNDDGSPTRETAEFPAELRFELDNRIIDTLPKELWQDQMYERYGQAQDDGVFVVDYTHDADGRPGNEGRNLYKPTTQGTKMEIIGSFGGGGVLTIVTNDVKPAGDGAQLTSGQAY